jgi:adenine-specific DNA-methyltransferase
MMSAAGKRRLAPDATIPSGALQDRSRALAQSVSAASLDIARTVAHRVALGWWQSLVEREASSIAHSIPAPTYAAPLLDLGPGVAAAAASLGEDFAQLPIATAAAEIGRLYCFLLPPKHRGTNGVFYTPSPLVSRLLDDAEAAGHDWIVGKVIDPSCGGGAFMVDAVGRMVKALAGADPAFVVASVSARLRGWDLDPFATWLSQLCVEAVLLPQVIASGKRLGAVTETRDSLDGWDGHEGAYGLVMGNPAFGKVKDNTGLRERFRRSLYGHPNLYGLFTDLAVHLTAPNDGVIAYLTPTSYLGGQYFKALRRLLGEKAPPVSIAIVEGREDVFEAVLQEVALSVFRRGPGGKPASCSVIHVEPDGLRVESAGSFSPPAKPEASWLMPRSAADAPFVERMLSMPSRLSDWGYAVSTGPLVWNRKKAKLHNDARKDSVPVVWAEAVCRQGKFRLKPEKRNHAAFYSPSGPRDPNLVTAPCLLLQRTTAKEQDRRLISAALPAAVIRAHGSVAVENHLNMILAVKPKPAVSMKVLSAFFASETADRVIRCINASVALSASEIEAMPLPPPGAIIAAMSARDPEAALRTLYGIAA